MLIRPNALKANFLALRKISPAVRTVSTGYLDLDPLFRVARGYMMIVSGYPSCGKSEFIDAILVNLSVTNQWKTLYFSPENYPIEEHMRKLAEKYVGKQFRNFTKDDITNSLAYLNNHFSWIDDDNPDLDGLIAYSKAEKRDKGIDCFVIDPWNAVTHSRGTSLIHEYLATALSKLIRHARKENLLIIVIAHPAKPVKDRNGNIGMPTLYDISDGAMWRNKADYGVIVHRPDMKKDEILVSVQKIKQKWMGRVGQTLMDYSFQTGRFKGKDEPDFLLPTEVPAPF